MTGSRSGKKSRWNATGVKALRKRMGYTQYQLAQEMGVRQQTVSDWETGVYRPRGASATLLSLIAEQAGFNYEVGGEE